MKIIFTSKVKILNNVIFATRLLTDIVSSCSVYLAEFGCFSALTDKYALSDSPLYSPAPAVLERG